MSIFIFKNQTEFYKLEKEQLQQRMLKSILQLSLNMKHDKSEYSIKKNKLVLLDNQSNHASTFGRSNLNTIKAAVKTHDRYTGGEIFSNSHKDHKSTNESTKSSFFKCENISAASKTKQIKFDCITYDYESTNQKLLYEFLMLQPAQTKNSSERQLNFDQQLNDQFRFQVACLKQNPKKTLTITFNYDIPYEHLEHLFISLMEIKKFQQSKFKIAHFQLRNNHISDYNKTQVKHKQKRDQMDNFSKEIDTCIKLDKTWKIKENISFKEFNLKNYKQKDILNKMSRTNYDKKTNQFFICEIQGGDYELNVIVLNRQKDYVLTKVQDKEIDQVFILLKNSNNGESNNHNQTQLDPRYKNHKINVEFTSSLALITQSYLISSDEVIFVSQYPNLNNSSSLEEHLRIPIKIDESHLHEVEKIVQFYNREKQSKLELQMSKMKAKLREIVHKRKQTQQNIAYLMNKYKKGFQNIFDSLNYLKKNNITDLGALRSNLENQIKEKQEEIKEEIEKLQQINYGIIVSEERNQYFRQKMEILKQNLEDDLKEIDSGISNNKGQSKANEPIQTGHLTSKKTPSHKSPKEHKKSPQKMEIQLTQTILKKFLQAEQQNDNPYSVQLQRQVDKYSNQMRQKTRQKLIKSSQVSEFHNLMDELRKKLSKHEFTKLQQKYLGLISMC